MPAFRKAAHRQYANVDRVATLRYPIDLSDRAGLSGLLDLEEQLFAPGAASSVRVAPGTIVVTVVLSGAVQIEPIPGQKRVLGPSMSLAHSSLRPGAAGFSNVSDSPTRLVRVTLAGATHEAVSHGGDCIAVENATVRLTDQYFGHGPGIVLVCDGAFDNEAVDPVDAGDWVELDGSLFDLAIIEGEGRLLVIELKAPGDSAR